MKPAHEFTISADNNTHLRFVVKVWGTYAKLQAARKIAAKKTKTNLMVCDGFCHRFNNKSCFDLDLGEIHLCSRKLSVNTIAHECLHAAVGLAQHLRPADDDHTPDSRDLCAGNRTIEEALAYPTGYMTEGIVWNLLRLKLKVKPINKK